MDFGWVWVVRRFQSCPNKFVLDDFRRRSTEFSKSYKHHWFSDGFCIICAGGGRSHLTKMQSFRPETLKLVVILGPGHQELQPFQEER